MNILLKRNIDSIMKFAIKHETTALVAFISFLLYDLAKLYMNLTL